MEWIKQKLVALVVARAKDYILKNWKTTLLGVVGAALTQYIPDPEARQAILAAVVAGIGLLAKDADKTGTVEQPRTPPEVVKEQTAAYEVRISEEDEEMDRLRRAGG